MYIYFSILVFILFCFVIFVDLAKQVIKDDDEEQYEELETEKKSWIA